MPQELAAAVKVSRFSGKIKISIFEMATKDKDEDILEQISNQEYEFGFSTDIEMDVLPAGLNEGVIKFISEKKNEPEWLLQWRLKGLTAFERQEMPHVHSTIFSPDEKYLYVADLGTDKEFTYRFDPNQPVPLTDAPDSFVSVTPGSGPRHIVFHPTLPLVYLISEMSGTIDAFHYDEHSGKLTPFQRVRTTTKSFNGDPGSADIHIRPDGKFLYASNRGVSNTLAVYAIGKEGRLTNKQYISVNGKHPRNFAIDPTGRFLLVANRDTDNIVVFAIDPVTGLLKATGKEMQVPNPVCLKFLTP